VNEILIDNRVKYISIDYFEAVYGSKFQHDKVVCGTVKHNLINNFHHLFVGDKELGLVSDYELHEHFICIENMDEKEIFKVCLKYGITIKL